MKQTFRKSDARNTAAGRSAGGKGQYADSANSTFWHDQPSFFADRMAYELNISLPTIDMHCRNLRRKLSAMTTSEAVAIAVRLDLIDR